MFAYQRSRLIDDIAWNSFPEEPHKANSYVTLECWKYEGVDCAINDSNIRVSSTYQSASGPNNSDQCVEERVKKWAGLDSPYEASPTPQNAGPLKGGIRLLFCDRPNTTPGMSISRAAFEELETVFDLHDATLPSMAIVDGAFSSFIERDDTTNRIKSIHIVVKATQKVEVANYTLSLSHDASNGWTKAFLCGDGVIHDRRVDRVRGYGSQIQQIISAIGASPLLWDNPLFLPCLFLQNYTQRVDCRLTNTDRSIIRLENDLGVTFAGGAGLDYPSRKWPQDINVKEVTIALHSILPQASFMLNCCSWLQRYADFLVDLGLQMEHGETLQRHRVGLKELREMVYFLTSIIKGMTAAFTAIKERANLQVNLLYNVISQQQSIVSRWDSRLNHLIAKSNKQDSISMTTFTFITAMFLPGTFIATLFSMTMFNWQPGDSDDSPSVSSGSQQSYVSNKFWIFWAIAIPLTLVTMASWYAWYRFANDKWISELYESTSSDTNMSAVPDFPYPVPEPKEGTHEDGRIRKALQWRPHLPTKWPKNTRRSRLEPTGHADNSHPQTPFRRRVTTRGQQSRLVENELAAQP